MLPRRLLHKSDASWRHSVAARLTRQWQKGKRSKNKWRRQHKKRHKKRHCNVSCCIPVCCSAPLLLSCSAAPLWTALSAPNVSACFDASSRAVNNLLSLPLTFSRCSSSTFSTSSPSPPLSHSICWLPFNLYWAHTRPTAETQRRHL